MKTAAGFGKFRFLLFGIVAIILVGGPLFYVSLPDIIASLRPPERPLKILDQPLSVNMLTQKLNGDFPKYSSLEKIVEDIETQGGVCQMNGSRADRTCRCSYVVRKANPRTELKIDVVGIDTSMDEIDHIDIRKSPDSP